MSSKTRKFISLWKRVISLGMSVVFVYVHVVYGAIEPAQHFWQERKASAQKKEQEREQRENALLAKIPAVDSLPQFQSLNNIPLPVSSSLDSLRRGSSRKLSKHVKKGPISQWLKAIPINHGTLKEVYVPSTWEPSDLMVIHIQDAHDNYEAQKNIAGIIQSLAEGLEGGKKNTLLVGLEGARGAYHFNPYRSFPKKEITRRVANHFLKEAFVSGPEYLGLTYQLSDDPSDGSPLLFWGVENEDLYLRNVQALKDSIALQEKARKIHQELSRAVDQMKEKILNPYLRKLDQKKTQKDKREIRLGDYVSYLAKGHGSPLLSYPQVGRFLKALKIEKSLDYGRVKKERSALTRTIAETLGGSSIELENLVAVSLSYRMGKIAGGAFYEYLKNLCRRYDIDLNRYPEMDRYIRYVLISDRINSQELFAEMNRLEKSVISSVISTNDEKAVMELSGDIALVGKLLSYSLSPQDWETYVSRRHEIYKIQEKIQQLLGLSDLTLYPIAELFKSFEDFSRASVARNKAMIENLLSSNHDFETPIRAVLVAGGFHTSGMMKILKEKKVAYAVVAPRIGKVEGTGTEYLKVFHKDETPLEKLFTSDRVSIKSRSGLVTQIMGEVPPAVRLLLPKLFTAEGAGLYAAEVLEEHTSLDGRRDEIEDAFNSLELGHRLEIGDAEVSRSQKDLKVIDRLLLSITIVGKSVRRVYFELLRQGTKIRSEISNARKVSSWTMENGDIHTLYERNAVLLEEAFDAWNRVRGWLSSLGSSFSSLRFESLALSADTLNIFQRLHEWLEEKKSRGKGWALLYYLTHPYSAAVTETLGLAGIVGIIALLDPTGLSVGVYALVSVGFWLVHPETWSELNKLRKGEIEREEVISLLLRLLGAFVVTAPFLFGWGLLGAGALSGAVHFIWNFVAKKGWLNLPYLLVFESDGRISSETLKHFIHWGVKLAGLNLVDQAITITNRTRIIVEQIKKGEDPELTSIIVKLYDSEPSIQAAAIKGMGQVIAAQISIGQSPDLSPITDRLDDPDLNVRAGAVEGLTQVIVAQINHDREYDLSPITDKLNDSNPYIRAAAIEGMGLIIVAQVNNGQEYNLSLIIDLLNDHVTYVRVAVVEGLGQVIAAQINHRREYDLSLIVDRLNDPSVQVAAIKSMGIIIAAQISNGEKYNLSFVMNKLVDSESDVQAAAIVTVGNVIAAQINYGEDPDLTLIIDKLGHSEPSVQTAALEGLGRVIVAQINHGRRYSLSRITDRLNDPESSVQVTAIKNLGIIFAAQIKNEENPDISSITDKLDDSDSNVQEAVFTAMGDVIIALIRYGGVGQNILYKVYLWVDSGISYIEYLVDKYLSSPDPKSFLKKMFLLLVGKHTDIILRYGLSQTSDDWEGYLELLERTKNIASGFSADRERFKEFLPRLFFDYLYFGVPIEDLVSFVNNSQTPEASLQLLNRYLGQENGDLSERMREKGYISTGDFKEAYNSEESKIGDVIRLENPDKWDDDELVELVETINQRDMELEVQMISPVLLGSEYETSWKEIPMAYIVLHELGTDMDEDMVELLTEPYLNSELVRKVQRGMEDRIRVHVHRTIERVINDEDHLLIQLLAHLYELGGIEEHPVIGVVRPFSAGEMREVSKGTDKKVFHTRAWEAHGNPALYKMLADYAAEFPSLWEADKSRILRVLGKYKNKNLKFVNLVKIKSFRTILREANLDIETDEVKNGVVRTIWDYAESPSHLKARAMESALRKTDRDELADQIKISGSVVENLPREIAEVVEAYQKANQVATRILESSLGDTSLVSYVESVVGTRVRALQLIEGISDRQSVVPNPGKGITFPPLRRTDDGKLIPVPAHLWNGIALTREIIGNGDGRTTEMSQLMEEIVERASQQLIGSENEALGHHLSRQVMTQIERAKLRGQIPEGQEERLVAAVEARVYGGETAAGAVVPDTLNIFQRLHEWLEEKKSRGKGWAFLYYLTHPYSAAVTETLGLAGVVGIIAPLDPTGLSVGVYALVSVGFWLVHPETWSELNKLRKGEIEREEVISLLLRLLGAFVVTAPFLFGWGLVGAGAVSGAVHFIWNFVAKKGWLNLPYLSVFGTDGKISNETLKSLIQWWVKLNNRDATSREALVSVEAMGDVVIAQIKKGQDPDLSPITEKLDHPKPHVQAAAVETLSRVIVTQINQGKKYDLSLITERLSHSETYIRAAAVEGLGQVIETRINDEEDPDLSSITDKLDDTKPSVQAAAIRSLGRAVAAQINQGKEYNLSPIADRLNHSEPFIQAVTVEAMGQVIAAQTAQIGRGRSPDVSLITDNLDHPDLYIQRSAIKALGQVLAKQKDPDVSLITHKLNDQNSSIQMAAIETMEVVITAQISHEKNPDLSFITDKLNGSKSSVQVAAVKVMGQVIAMQISYGKDPDLSFIIEKLDASDPSVQAAAVESVGQVIAAQINQGQDPDLSPITDKLHVVHVSIASAVNGMGYIIAAQVNQGQNPELSLISDKLRDPDSNVKEAAVVGIGRVVVALIDKDKLDDLSLQKIHLWISSRFAYYEELVEKYIASLDPRLFLERISVLLIGKHTNSLLEHGLSRTSDDWESYLELLKRAKEIASGLSTDQERLKEFLPRLFFDYLHFGIPVEDLVGFVNNSETPEESLRMIKQYLGEGTLNLTERVRKKGYVSTNDFKESYRSEKSKIGDVLRLEDPGRWDDNQLLELVEAINERDMELERQVATPTLIGSEYETLWRDVPIAYAALHALGDDVDKNVVELKTEAYRNGELLRKMQRGMGDPLQVSVHRTVERSIAEEDHLLIDLIAHLYELGESDKDAIVRVSRGYTGPLGWGEVRDGSKGVSGRVFHTQAWSLPGTPTLYKMLVDYAGKSPGSWKFHKSRILQVLGRYKNEGLLFMDLIKDDNFRLVLKEYGLGVDVVKLAYSIRERIWDYAAYPTGSKARIIQHALEEAGRDDLAKQIKVRVDGTHVTVDRLPEEIENVIEAYEKAERVVNTILESDDVEDAALVNEVTRVVGNRSEALKFIKDVLDRQSLLPNPNINVTVPSFKRHVDGWLIPVPAYVWNGIKYMREIIGDSNGSVTEMSRLMGEVVDRASQELIGNRDAALGRHLSRQARMQIERAKLRGQIPEGQEDRLVAAVESRVYGRGEAAAGAVVPDTLNIFQRLHEWLEEKKSRGKGWAFLYYLTHPYSAAVTETLGLAGVVGVIGLLDPTGLTLGVYALVSIVFWLIHPTTWTELSKLRKGEIEKGEVTSLLLRLLGAFVVTAPFLFGWGLAGAGALSGAVHFIWNFVAKKGWLNLPYLLVLSYGKVPGRIREVSIEGLLLPVVQNSLEKQMEQLENLSRGENNPDRLQEIARTIHFLELTHLFLEEGQRHFEGLGRRISPEDKLKIVRHLQVANNAEVGAATAVSLLPGLKKLYQESVIRERSEGRREISVQVREFARDFILSSARSRALGEEGLSFEGVLEWLARLFPGYRISQGDAGYLWDRGLREGRSLTRNAPVELDDIDPIRESGSISEGEILSIGVSVTQRELTSVQINQITRAWEKRRSGEKLDITVLVEEGGLSFEEMKKDLRGKLEHPSRKRGRLDVNGILGYLDRDHYREVQGTLTAETIYRLNQEIALGVTQLESLKNVTVKAVKHSEILVLIGSSLENLRVFIYKIISETQAVSLGEMDDSLREREIFSMQQ